MKTNRNQISKEMIIETTLRLIEENQGIKDVNLRGIAKMIGCAHTNLYNYFNSLDEIFWEALGQVIRKMINDIDTNFDRTNNSEKNFYLLLSNIIDFSMAHPGWYRLIWFESLSGAPSDEVIKILHAPGEGFKSKLIKVSNNKLSEEKGNLVSEILLTYLHGELCKWINNRSYIDSNEETKMKIVSNIKYLYKLLIQEDNNCSCSYGLGADGF